MFLTFTADNRIKDSEKNTVDCVQNTLLLAFVGTVLEKKHGELAER